MLQPLAVRALCVATLATSLLVGVHAEAEETTSFQLETLKEAAVTKDFTLGRPFNFRLVPDGSAILFLRSGARDYRASIFEYNVETKKERLVLSADQLLAGAEERLSTKEKAARERKRIKTSGFTGFDLSLDGSLLLTKLSGGVYLFDRIHGRAARIDLPEGDVLDPRLSPDGRALAFVRDNDLYHLRFKRWPRKSSSKLKGELTALTSGGTDLNPYGLAEFVAQEEMDRYDGFWFSSDSERIVYQWSDQSELEQFTIADAARPEQPSHSFPYPRPGKSNVVVRLFVTSVKKPAPVEVTWDHDRFPYLARVTWERNAPLAILVQDRLQQTEQFLRVNPNTGRTSLLYEENDSVWLNLSESTPFWLPDGKSYLWATEKSGAWRLERHFVPSGRTAVRKKETVLPRAHGFDRLVHANEENVWFLGGPNPVETNLYRVALSGGRPERISKEGGEHNAAFSEDGSTFVLTRVDLSHMPISRVYLDTGSQDGITEIAKEPSEVPLVELVDPSKAGGFFAAIIRPQKFNQRKKYPVILYVYGGPGHQVVRSTMVSYIMHQWLADHGFIVVCIDGRGTPRRGRRFERALHGRVGSVPLADQVKGLQALGRNYRELNLDRVGTYGWSYGGYLAALSVMKNPEVFKAAVAGAPVADWRYYDTHYTERYLGLPEQNEKAYETASLLTHAKSLERPLLLIHGIADDNVYFAHTLQLTDQLFREGRPFELLPLVGLTHQVSDPEVRQALYLRIVSFFRRELK